MTNAKTEHKKSARPLAEEVGEKADRKLKAHRRANHGAWLGLSMMGLVGWSIVVPTLLGTASTLGEADRQTILDSVRQALEPVQSEAQGAPP